MSIFGVGVDLLKRGQLGERTLQSGDPFLKAVFSEQECQEAARRESPERYFEDRFCAKEAVFKALHMNPNHVKFRDISIVNDDNGAPNVSLSGQIALYAASRGVGRIELSISGDQDQVISFAVAMLKESDK